MKIQTKHFFIDTALLILMFITAITGLLVWLIFPHELEFKEICHFLGEVHKWASLGLVALTVYHFVIHWDWYKRILRNLKLK